MVGQARKTQCNASIENAYIVRRFLKFSVLIFFYFQIIYDLVSNLILFPFPPQQTSRFHDSVSVSPQKTSRFHDSVSVSHQQSSRFHDSVYVSPQQTSRFHDFVSVSVNLLDFMILSCPVNLFILFLLIFFFLLYFLYFIRLYMLIHGPD